VSGKASRIVTLLTDFGTSDGYVGAIKGVIAARAPEATIIDITHDVPAGDVRAGAFALAAAAVEFPAGTVHLAVVDPGVGSDRAGVAVWSRDSWFVGPDNGLLSSAATGFVEAFVLDRPQHYLRPDPAPTFHGRDVFAPVAAALAAGEAGHCVGTKLERSLVDLTVRPPEHSDEYVTGSVVHVDRFGNLVTNLAETDLPPSSSGWIFRVGDIAVRGLSRTYSDVATGQFVAVVGSGGTVEISVRDGSAEDHSGAVRDASVVVECA
jgi:S-adenosylmethionine hydrolase